MPVILQLESSFREWSSTEISTFFFFIIIFSRFSRQTHFIFLSRIISTLEEQWLNPKIVARRLAWMSRENFKSHRLIITCVEKVAFQVKCAVQTLAGKATSLFFESSFFSWSWKSSFPPTTSVSVLYKFHSWIFFMAMTSYLFVWFCMYVAY